MSQPQPLIATHELDGVLLAQKKDAKERIYYLNVETKNRAKLDGKEPHLLDAAAPSVEPPLVKPEDSKEASEKGEAEQCLTPLHIFAIAAHVVCDGPPHYGAPGASASLIDRGKRTLQLAIPISPEQGEAVYIAELPEHVPISLTRIR